MWSLRSIKNFPLNQISGNIFSAKKPRQFDVRGKSSIPKSKTPHPLLPPLKIKNLQEL